MKYKISNEKGITMMALVITVIILVILTNMLIYNAQDNVHIKALTNLYNDIDMLREKVSLYYNDYGKIPAEIKYTIDTNTSGISNVISTQNDTGDFYVIDLEAMKGITLNYGRDYEKVKNNKEDVNSYTDIYIINENSHNIFYVKGISIKENNTTKTYYTDYTEPDETAINLRYVDGILIPEGYYYIGKTIDDSSNETIVISQQRGTVDINDTNQYIWTKQIAKLEKKPDSINLEDSQKEYQFIQSVNTYKGYFKNNEGKVQYVLINEEKWSEAYTKEMEYKDRNGDKVTVPEGFKVSMCTTMNTVENGFVVKDSNDNEWVWIEVPESVFKTATNNSDYDNIKADLLEYAKEYRKGSNAQEFNWNDEWYDGCGITDSTTYTELYNKMLRSLYTNKGFWISRYEIGDETATDKNGIRTSSSGTSGKAVSKANQIPYNFIKCDQAQTLAKDMSKDSGKTSSLMFGIQWDLVCKFIEESSDLEIEDINNNSSSWGNYSDAEFGITTLNAKQYNSSAWKSIIGTKTSSGLLTTGASYQNKILNIYDLAGNQFEWTLEYSNDNTYKSVSRGGRYSNKGNEFAADSRVNNESTRSTDDFGFRVVLY